ncbi:Ig-like domain-containing protein [Aeromonas veronii]|uniref:Ig-like domain-containing protein n=1 Tax=Aeromonas veronii TaxID=654 RepID=UPI003CE5BB65
MGGTVTDLKSTDGGQTWTGTFTPPRAIPAPPACPVKNAATPDLNGNVGNRATVTKPRSNPRPRAWRSTFLTTC